MQSKRTVLAIKLKMSEGKLTFLTPNNSYTNSQVLSQSPYRKADVFLF